MPTVRLWSNVSVSMQSVIASALTINSISKANPGVVGYTGTDPTDGDYIYLSDIQGMNQLVDRYFRVDTVNGAGNTFELEGEDTSAYDTFSSGGFQLVTFGTSIVTVVRTSSSGGGFNMIDTTTIHGSRQTKRPGLPNSREYSFTHIWDVSDAGLKAIKSASDSQARRAFKFQFGSGGPIMVFGGYVAADLTPAGDAMDKVVCESIITMDGSPTFYAS